MKFKYSISICLLLNCFKYFICSELFEDQISSIVTEIQNETCMPTFCQSTKSKSTDLASFCKLKNSTIEARCCLKRSTNETFIIGVDYTECKIEKLSDTLGTLKKDTIKYVEILDLRNNTLIECGSRETFAGFVKLNELYLSDLSVQICDCPGGNYSWSKMTNGSCIGRKDLCNTTFSNRINCTENSQCVENGPANFLCECKPGYHGYKCLYEGDFPTLLFTIIISSSTLVLSGLLWHTQRRHVKTN